ncbi:hypothetical protein QYE76_024117 [Lolium multiflorum]|uniref:F-box domain-containing protein n=1 Tax=Lolium multiflorum TaxID=4521 RepID=A0AAD8RBU3_LOLMU|nr:hypothetical protein QYE76_024117 [Lolium multiflorum]
MAPMRVRFDRHSAAAASTHLPPPADVVFEILSWLPAKFLRRCRCVCTSWRALISDPAFIAEHRSRAEPLLVAVTDSIRGGTVATTSVQIMDTDGYVVRFVDLGGLWTFRASLGDLVLVTSSPGHDSRAAIRVIDLASGGTILSCPGPAAEAADHVTTWFGFGRAARSGVLKVIASCPGPSGLVTTV